MLPIRFGCPFLFVVAAAIFCCALPICGQQPLSPREQFAQYVAALQKSPSDDVLRRKIIELALTLDPKPTVPDAAVVAAAKAKTIFAHAAEPGSVSQDDLKSAADAFAEASLHAPWVAEYYFNRGLALEKAKDFDNAIRSFNWYLLAAPNSSDANDVRGRIEGIKYAQDQEEKVCSEVKAHQDELTRREGDVRQTTVLLDAVDNSNGSIFLSFKDVDNRPSDEYWEFAGWRVLCGAQNESYCKDGSLRTNQTYAATLRSSDTEYKLPILSVKVGDSYVDLNDPNHMSYVELVTWLKSKWDDAVKSCR